MPLPNYVWTEPSRDVEKIRTSKSLVRTYVQKMSLELTISFEIVYMAWHAGPTYIGSHR